MDVNVIDLGDESSVSPTLGIDGSETVGGVLPCLRFLLLMLTPRMVRMKKSNGPRLLKFGMILNLLLLRVSKNLNVCGVKGYLQLRNQVAHQLLVGI
jgi:hypothetical protein